jgi:hypothetical protein
MRDALQGTGVGNPDSVRDPEDARFSGPLSLVRREPAAIAQHELGWFAESADRWGRQQRLLGKVKNEAQSPHRAALRMTSPAWRMAALTLA